MKLFAHKILLLLILIVGLYYKSDAQSIEPFKAGDRIAFVGNSITDGGHYHSYIWLYYMTRFPDRRITCFNAGIGGDAISNIVDRFDDDVLAKKPNVITLTWGMNDSGYFEWYRQDAQGFMDKRLAQTYTTYASLERKLKAQSSIRTILIGGSPYDETTRFNKQNLYPGKAAYFSKIIDYQRNSAKLNNWGFVDFYHPMDAINKREQAKDTTFSLTPNDKIHPDNDGHMVMAYLFLKAQGLAGKVADLSISAADKRVIKAENCKISNVIYNGKNISFNYLAKSLPYPVDTVPRAWGNRKKQSDALALVPFTSEFNQEMLTVKNLNSGNYRLMIDGEVMGQFTAAQLASGVNLAEIVTTPQYQQAAQIRELNEERWEIERRLRMYVWMQFDFLKGKGLLHNDSNAALDTVRKYAAKDMFVNGNKDNYTRARFKSVRDAWQRQMNLLTDQIYSINKPQTHKIELVAM